MKIPRDLSGKELVKALARLGFVKVRQTGSHVRLVREASRVTIPMHHEIKIKTLKSILLQANIPLEELLKAL